LSHPKVSSLSIFIFRGKMTKEYYECPTSSLVSSKRNETLWQQNVREGNKIHKQQKELLMSNYNCSDCKENCPDQAQPNLPTQAMLLAAEEICRETYDRFVMGGWEPQDTQSEVAQILAKHLSIQLVDGAYPPKK
jgi:hypothetical protein